MKATAERSSRWSEFLAPAPLLAVVLMWVNDHILKAAFHNEITGKLSDLAFCFFGPLFASALLGVVIPGAKKVRLIGGAVGAAAIFIALELSTGAQDILRVGFEGVGLPGLVYTRDLTDLGALAMIPLATVYGLRRWRAERVGRVAPISSRVVRGGVLGATLLVLAAESPPDQTCKEWAQPMLFSVTGDCGPPGLLVIGGRREFNGDWTAQVWNAGALGFTLDGTGPGAFSEREPLRLQGLECPPQFRKGKWRIQQSDQPGRRDANSRSCDIVAVDDGLVATCGEGLARTCRATLKMANP